MESATRRKLAEFLRSEGASLVDDPQRVRALLLDTCPDAKTEIGLLTLAIEDDIPLRLVRSSADAVMKDGAIARAIDDFQTARRVDRGAAEWVVGSWAWALGLSNTEPQDGSGDQQDSMAPATGIPGVVNGPEVGAGGPSVGGVSGGVSSGGYSPGPYVPQSSGGSWQAPGSGAGSYQPGPYVPSSGSCVPPPGGGPWPPGQVGGHPNLPPPRPSPPKKLWQLPLLIGGSVVAMLVLVVGVVAGSQMISSMATSSTSSPLPSSPSPSPTPTAKEAQVTITDRLVSGEASERVTVYLEGRNVGEMYIDQSRRKDQLSFSIPVGNYNYQLTASITYVNSSGDARTFDITGRGTIYVTDGVTFAVATVGSGENIEFTLREVS